MGLTYRPLQGVKLSVFPLTLVVTVTIVLPLSYRAVCYDI